MVLLLDNYDSFTWNLQAQVSKTGMPVRVVRNDEVEYLDQDYPWTGILISPGPGRPKDAGISEAILKKYLGKIPILGVCLGHQLIGEIFGAEVTHAPKPIHGKTSDIYHDNTGLFADLPQPFQAMRYHSLVLNPQSMPQELRITAQTDDGIIMGIQHKLYNLAGVQFHPESILTPMGDRLMGNWLKIIHSHKESDYGV